MPGYRIGNTPCGRNPQTGPEAGLPRWAVCLPDSGSFPRAAGCTSITRVDPLDPDNRVQATCADVGGESAARWCCSQADLYQWGIRAPAGAPSTPQGEQAAQGKVEEVVGYIGNFFGGDQGQYAGEDYGQAVAGASGKVVGAVIDQGVAEGGGTPESQASIIPTGISSYWPWLLVGGAVLAGALVIGGVVVTRPTAKDMRDAGLE
jgi:hypothetical protein